MGEHYQKFPEAQPGQKRKLVQDVLGHYGENPFVKSVLSKLPTQTPIRLDKAQLGILGDKLRPNLGLTADNHGSKQAVTEIALWIASQSTAGDLAADDPAAKEQ